MKIEIDEGFQSLLPALDTEEKQLLEESLVNEGCRDSLIVWQTPDMETPVLLDGHNRHEICTRLALPYNVYFIKDHPERKDVLQWIAHNQKGRRNMTPDKKAALAINLKNQLSIEAKKRQAHGQTAPGRTLPSKSAEALPQFSTKSAEAGKSGEAMEIAAETMGITKYAIREIEKIKKQSPELFEQIRSGELSTKQAKKELKKMPQKIQPVVSEKKSARSRRPKLSKEGGDIWLDGKKVRVTTTKELHAWLNPVMTVRFSLINLFKLEITPEEYLRWIHPAHIEEVDERLDSVTAWLVKLQACWKNRNKLRAVS